MACAIAGHPYNPFVITITDSDTGDPIPLVELVTVNKIHYLTDSNGQMVFNEPGLMNIGNVFFYVHAPHGYQELNADFFGYRGKSFQPTPGGSGHFTLTADPDPGAPPAYTDLELFRLNHPHDTTSGTYQPFMITVLDSETGRGVPLVEFRTDEGLVYYSDSAGRIAFYEPSLMDQNIFFHIKSYGYTMPAGGGISLMTTSDGNDEVYIGRENIAERLYRITGGGIYNDSVLLEQSVPLANPLLSGKVVGQDTVDMCEYNGGLFWLWGDTERPSYPLGNFKTSCATSEIPGLGGLDPSAGVDLAYFVNGEGFSKEMFPRSDAGLIWMNTLVAVDDNGTERLVGSYSVISGDAAGEQGIALFNDSSETFESLTIFQPNQNIILSGQAHKKDGYVYVNCPYPTVRIQATLSGFQNPAGYEAFTCLMPGTSFNGSGSQVERDGENNLVWGWKQNTSSISDGRWQELLNAGLVSQNETWNWLKDTETGDHILLAGASAGYNPYHDCWVMVGQQQWGSSFLGEVWVAAAESPQGPWTKGRKVVTHSSPDDNYTFYNVAYHPEFNQNDGQYIYLEGTYVTTYSGNPNPTPRYDYNQMMYRIDLSDSRLDGIWPTDPAENSKLLAHWTLDQSDYTGGSYTDISGQGHDAAVIGSPTFVSDQSGSANRALSLDGVNGTAQAGTWNPSEENGQMALSMWFYCNAGQGGTLLAKRDAWDAGQMMWHLIIDDANSKISFFHAPFNFAEMTFSEGNISRGQWHQLTVMHDANTNTLQYYVDAELKKTMSFGLAGGTTAQINIGMAEYGAGPNEAFTGILDDVRIYNYLLNQKEILDIYNDVSAATKFMCLDPYARALDVAGPDTVITDLTTFVPEPDCVVDLYDFIVFSYGWLENGYGEIE